MPRARARVAQPAKSGSLNEEGLRRVERRTAGRGDEAAASDRLETRRSATPPSQPSGGAERNNRGPAPNGRKRTSKPDKRRQDDGLQDGSTGVRVALNTFLNAIDKMRECAKTYVALARAADDKVVAASKLEIDAVSRAIDQIKGSTSIESQQILHMAKRLSSAAAAMVHLSGNLLAQSIFVSLFSVFDAFTGNLLKALYTARPERLHSIERSIHFKDLLALGTPEELRGFILDAEIEQLRRDSYVEQFKQLEKRFGVSTLREFPAWPEFVERAQRRNLLVHSDGLVSRQYLQVCLAEKCRFDKTPALGERLRVNDAYLARSMDLLYEVGVKLQQTLWRVLLPEDLEAADSDLNEKHLNLLGREAWPLAVTVGEFAWGQPRFSSERMKLIALVNYAQSLKWLGEERRAQELVGKQDWSSATADFHLAVAVLSDDFAGAARRMKAAAGASITQADFHTWPLFRKFRRSSKFRDEYKSLFGVEYGSAERQRAKEYAQALVGDSRANQATARDIGGG